MRHNGRPTTCWPGSAISVGTESRSTALPGANLGGSSGAAQTAPGRRGPSPFPTTTSRSSSPVLCARTTRAMNAQPRAKSRAGTSREPRPI
eukprot:8715654-Alexandrium_andersonii.AAC.1